MGSSSIKNVDILVGLTPASTVVVSGVAKQRKGWPFPYGEFILTGTIGAMLSAE